MPERPGAVSTMFIVSRPQPSATKYSSAAAITSAAVRPGAYASAQSSKPPPVDTHRVTDAGELGLALHRAREIELDVERDDVEPLERPVVPNRHHVVEAVDADPLPAGVPGVRGDRGAGMRVEALLDQGGPVLADVPRLRREDDERRRRPPAPPRTRSDGRSGIRTCTSPLPRSRSTRFPATTRPSSPCSAIAARTFE